MTEGAPVRRVLGALRELFDSEFCVADGEGVTVGDELGTCGKLSGRVLEDQSFPCLSEYALLSTQRGLVWAGVWSSGLVPGARGPFGSAPSDPLTVFLEHLKALAVALMSCLRACCTILSLRSKMQSLDRIMS